MLETTLDLNTNSSTAILSPLSEVNSLSSLLPHAENLGQLALGLNSEQTNFEQILAQFSPAAVASPDLIIRSISIPASVVAGTSVNFNYALKNRGTGATVGSSGTDFYLSTDTRLDASDIHLGNDYVAPLAAGVSRTESTSVFLDNNLNSGLYYLLAKADGTNVIAESSETNNILAKAINITSNPQPDLVVSNLSTPTVAAAGDYISFNYTLSNQGNASTDWYSHVTKFFLSSDRTLDSLDTYLGYDYSYSLEPGASITESTSFYLNENLSAGTYYIFAQADGDNAIAESNEANNLTSKTINITTPDLVISNLSAPASAVGGNYLDISYTITNQGLAATDWSSGQTKLYLSNNTTLDSADTLLDYDYNYFLNAGASATSSFYFRLSEALTTGTYYLIAQADGDNNVLESNESNNTLYRSINITEAPKPDLNLTSLTAPASVTAGTFLDLTFAIRNSGDASTGWYSNNTGFYLSRDNVLDSSDTYIDEVSTYSLLPGETRNVSASIALSSRLAGGTYYLIAKADHENEIFEKNENNNTFSKTIQVIPSPDGYSSINGYGLVNAAAVVAKALGQNPYPDVPNLGGDNWGVDLVKAPEVWAKGYTGQGIIVAVLDTGVDRNHQDLSSNIWKNTGEIEGNGVDDDRNGYVDDVWGWNTVDNNNNTMDVQSHGTHVSGTIAGLKNNLGVTGVAYNAKIMPVKVLNDSGSGTWASVANGIRYAVNNGAKVINMSLGGSAGNSELESAVQYAASRGVICVMSAGNEGNSSPGYPGYYANNWGIVVGAVDSNNELADFSNRAGGAKFAYVTAPGVNVKSSVPNNGYDNYSGTSMAAPHVSGVVALLLSAKAGLTDAQVRQLLTTTAENAPTSGSGSSVTSFNASEFINTSVDFSLGTNRVFEIGKPELNLKTEEIVTVSREFESLYLADSNREQTHYTEFDALTGLVNKSPLTALEVAIV